MVMAPMPVLLEIARGLAHGLFVQRLAHLARGLDAFGHFDAELARHGDRRLAHAVVVQVRTGLAADFQHVAETARGDQADRRALAFDDQVRRHRRAVPHMRDLEGSTPCISSKPAMPVAMARDGSSGVDGTLWKCTTPAVSSIMVKSVKRPADVYADTVHIVVFLKESIWRGAICAAHPGHAWSRHSRKGPGAAQGLFTVNASRA